VAEKQEKQEKQGQPIALKTKRRKQKIPAAFREQIWFRDYGHTFEGKCPTKWCSNLINVFDFQSGHNIPESKGGPTIPDNLIPVCARCNMSMGDRFSFTEWSSLNGPMAARAIAPIAPPPKSSWCCV
jgi:5-methylcytosine-specific restriction endonuclease McrA